MGRVEGYDYELLLRLVLQEWRLPCWVCSLEGQGAGGRAEVARCESVSGDVVDAHHVLSKQFLGREFPHGAWRMAGGDLVRAYHSRRIDVPDMVRAVIGDPEARQVSLGALLMDRRNVVPVRRYHHDAIERRMWSPLIEQVPAPVIEFAAELGVGWQLERVVQGRG